MAAQILDWVTLSHIIGSALREDFKKDVFTDSYHKPAYQPIADFYAGKSVFITGATGFIGRMMIERLLFTCKDLDKVYVLIREKKNASVQERLEEILKNPIFTKLKQKRLEDISKVVPIRGDIAEPNLGIKFDDEQTLIEKVSVVFHSAAEVRFTVPTSEHMRINYEGTKRVLDLGKKMKHLDVFVHVSTAYTTSFEVVDEIAYPPPHNIDDVYKTLETNDPKEIQKLQGRLGNSYVLSKKMVEAYVATNYGNMSTVIVRPPMVTGAYKQPLAGYNDSWVMGTSLLCSIASGLTRVLYGSKHVIVDIMPVDYICHFLIIVAARNSRINKCNVYNIASSETNPINWERLTKLYIKESKKHDYVVMPFPIIYFTRAMWAIPILRFGLEMLPASIADAWLRVTGREPRYLKLHKRVVPRGILGKPVTNTSWLFKNTRAQALISTLDEPDRKTFQCDPKSIKWDEYIPIYCKGVKEYMLGNKKSR